MSNPSDVTSAAPEPVAECPHCQKPMPLCICDSVTPLDSRIALLILQHPQEQDRALGTARLTALHFNNAVVKIGLSWPSLAKALGQPVADPARWAVLYLGSARATDLDSDAEIIALTRKGDIAENAALVWLDLALAVNRDNLTIGVQLRDLRRAEIKHRPARGIFDRTSQRLAKARPRQADPDDRARKMLRGQPRGAERPVLLLRVLQDQERDFAFDRRDAVADAERQRLAAMRAVLDRLDGGGCGIGLF